MKKTITLSALLFLVTTISLAQQKKLQLSFNINPVDAHAAAEISLSKSSTLYTAIGFGYGSVSSIYLNNYYDKSRHNQRNSDVVLPEIYFAPYLNIQYRNYFMRNKDNQKGIYTANNSGMYLGARLKMYTAPVITVKEDGKDIKENYMLGLMVGYQKAVGAKKRLILNTNGGVSNHANYNLSFAVLKPMFFTSIGYIIK